MAHEDVRNSIYSYHRQNLVDLLIEKRQNVFSLWSPTPFKVEAGQSSYSIPSLVHINAEMYPIARTFSLTIK